MILHFAISRLAPLDSEPVLSLVLWEMDSFQTLGLVSSIVVSFLPYLVEGGVASPSLPRNLIFIVLSPSSSGWPLHFLGSSALAKTSFCQLVWVQSSVILQFQPVQWLVWGWGGELGCHCAGQRAQLSGHEQREVNAVQRSHFPF